MTSVYGPAVFREWQRPAFGSDTRQRAQRGATECVSFPLRHRPAEAERSGANRAIQRQSEEFQSDAAGTTRGEL